MESSLLTQKLKSNHLIVVILSYLGTYKQMKNMLKLLSHKGHQFLKNNQGGLKVFCQFKETEILDLELKEDSILYLSDTIKEIQKLNVEQISAINEELLQKLEKVKLIKDLEIQRKSRMIKDGAIPICFKTILNKVRKCSLHYEEVIFQKDLENVAEELSSIDFQIHKIKIQSDLAGTPDVQPELWNSIFKKGLEYISLKFYTKISDSLLQYLQNNELELKAFTLIWNDHDKFCNKFNEKDILSKFCNLEFLQFIHNGFLKIAFKEIFQLQFVNLQTLYLEIDYFNFSFLKNCPNLSWLKLYCLMFGISDDDINSTTKLKRLGLEIQSNINCTLISHLLTQTQQIQNLELRGAQINTFDKLFQKAKSLQAAMFVQCFEINPLILNQILSSKCLQECKLEMKISLDNKNSINGTFMQNKSIQNLEMRIIPSKKNRKPLSQVSEVLVNFLKGMTNLKTLAFCVDKQELARELLPEILKIKPNLELILDNFIENPLNSSTILSTKIMCLKGLEIYPICKKEFRNLLKVLKTNKSLFYLKFMIEQSDELKSGFQVLFKSIKTHPKLKLVHFWHALSRNDLKNLDLKTLILENCRNLKELRILTLSYLELEDINPRLWNEYIEELTLQVRIKLKKMQLLLIT